MCEYVTVFSGPPPSIKLTGERIEVLVFGERTTTAQLYPGRDTFEFDQGQVTKNQPITLLALLSESLGI